MKKSLQQVPSQEVTSFREPNPYKIEEKRVSTMLHIYDENPQCKTELIMLGNLIKPHTDNVELTNAASDFDGIALLIQENPRLRPVAEALMQFARAQCFLESFVDRVDKL